MNPNNSIFKAMPVLFGFFIMGFADVVGITVKHIKEDFGLSNTMSSMIPVVLFSMFLFFAVPTGILMTKIGRKKTVLYSNLLISISLFIPLIEYTYANSLIAFAILGLGNTMLQVSLNPLLTNVVSDNKLTSSLTAGQFIKAISSFSAPFVAIFATNFLGEWQYMFPIFAILTIISNVWLMATTIEEQGESKASNFINVLSLLKEKGIFFLFLGIFFVVGVDVGMNTIAPQLLGERCSLDSLHAGYGSSVYFAFRTAGAFIGAFILAKFNPIKYFRINIAIATLALVVMIFIAELEGLYLLYGLIGFTIANIFSILFSHALQLHPDKANEISGLMISGVFGGAVITFFMGLASDAIGSQLGSVLVILVSASYLLVCSFVLKTKK